MANHLYYGDNLAVLREHIRDETVDLIYLDPPFNSNATYNVLFRGPSGDQSQAQIEVFEDTWHWNNAAERAFDEVMQGPNSDVANMLRAMRSFLHDNDMMAYLTHMAVRLVELHRVLKPTGSIYLHCDPTASHYLKVLMDAVFGKENFLSEVIWKRTSAHNSAKRWGPVHDTILLYKKGAAFLWNRVLQPLASDHIATFYKFEDGKGRFAIDNLTGAGTRSGESGKSWRGVDPTARGRHWAVPTASSLPPWINLPADYAELPVQGRLDFLDAQQLIQWPDKEGGMPRFKRYLTEYSGASVQDVIADIAPVSASDAERLGYPTQKPVALLERILSASSNPGDVVLDPFCGCGTTVHAAQKLGRQWIGIDITHLSISLIEKRLKDAFPGIAFEVHGAPKDMEGARDLANRDKYQFQWWAVSLVDAVPFGGKKKGADGGIDGHIFFRSGAKEVEKAIVSVKGGGVGVKDIRELTAVADRERAKIGVYISLEPHTRPMIEEAAGAGLYDGPTGKVPKIQIFTIEELFAGKKPQIPLMERGFKAAAREESDDQSELDL